LIKGLFKKRKYITVSSKALMETSNVKKPSIPNGMWLKCPSCGQTLYKNDVEQNLQVCNFCGYYLRLDAYYRISITADKDSFEEFNKGLETLNPLNFKGYENKISGMKKNSGLNEAVVTGKCTINNYPAIICVMDSNFMMGSMGSVVGEKVTRAVEKSIELKLPLIIFTASGGARMLEGMFSLMQMAKVSGAISKHNESGLLYITVLTDPTTGGVTASFAMLGDIILAEDGALIGFAGKRVIEQTINQKLPDGFQKAEFQLKHGFVDKIVTRVDMKNTLGKLLALHSILCINSFLFRKV
jgi:acetyl-CoA carboxylase carboxyl transferase subunit beta